jgi:uncharacterized protein (TIGR02246 family)
MRLLATIVVGAVMAMSAAAPAWAQGNDEAAVRDVVKRYVDAREARDAKALAELFTEDADQLVSSGEWRKGREQVVKGGLASSAASSGKRTISVQSVRFVAKDVAVADGPYEIAGGGTGGENRKMWTSFVMTRGAGGWRIAAIRNMLPAPNAPPAPKP